MIKVNIGVVISRLALLVSLLLCCSFSEPQVLRLDAAHHGHKPIAVNAATDSSLNPPEDLAAVEEALQAAYVIKNQGSHCSAPDADILGWPRQELLECDYSVGSGANLRNAYVILLNVDPSVISTWIQTACSKYISQSGSCFSTTLSCAVENSGMMIPISGNMMEDMDGEIWKNYFFRDGMTVSIDGQPNGTTEQISLLIQRKLASMPDNSISYIPSGLTRYWRTTPAQFLTFTSATDSPIDLGSENGRQRWLTIAHNELAASLKSSNNRLLNAWVTAHSKTIAAGVCPSDDDP